MIGPRPLCMNCLHFDFENRKSLTCRAFPNGIPEKILTNRADHRREYPGDHGLRYDPIDPDYEILPDLAKRPG
jgi:hypothetical protein